MSGAQLRDFEVAEEALHEAMALALRSGSPIFVERSVLDKSSKPGDADAVETERLRRWLETVDPEELGKYEM